MGNRIRRYDDINKNNSTLLRNISTNNDINMDVKYNLINTTKELLYNEDNAMVMDYIRELGKLNDKFSDILNK